MTNFWVTEREAGESRVVIDVHGELGLPDVGRLEETLEVAGRERSIVVGLEGCEFVDSLALAALLRARDRVAADGGNLVLGGPTGQVRRVLDVSGLDLQGLVFDSVDEALDRI